MATLPPIARAGLLAASVLHAVGRIGVVGIAIVLSRDTSARTWIGAGGLALVFWAGSVLRSALDRQSRAALASAAVSSLLRSELLSRPPDEDLHATVFEGIHYGAQLLSTHLPALVGNAAALVPVCAILAAIASPAILTAASVVLALALASALVARGVTARYATATQMAWQGVVEDVAATIDGRLDIVASGLAEEFHAELGRRVARWRLAADRSAWWIAVAGRTPIMVAAGVAGLALAVEPHLRQPLGAVGLRTATVAAAALPTFFGLLRDSIDVARTHVRAATFVALLEARPAPSGGMRGAPLPALPAPIEWRGVTFTYGSTPGGAEDCLAVSDVSIDWRPGQILTLQGPNGAGKSTLLRLLVGLARPTGGSILVGGIDLFDLDMTGWRRAIAYLPQRPYLNERGSVRDAIRLLAPEASDAQMRRALESMELWGTLSAHALRGDPLASRVGSLSVGERQRLALARLHCQKAVVVLLDEPDANLDVRGLDVLERLIRELSPDRMVAIAAHSPRLLRLGHQCVVLPTGTHARVAV